MPPTLNIVIPAKDPHGAKSRLSARLSPDQREALALALFRQTLSFFQTFPAAHHVLVVTDSERMQAIALEFGATVLLEQEATGETDAVNKATAWSVEHGFGAQLVVPADMAAWSEKDMLQLVGSPYTEPCLVLCPATDDDGTNAILSMPPDVVPFRFGDKSFPDYRQRAVERNVPCTVLRLPSLVLDLDTPEDLDRFLMMSHPSPLRELVDSWKLTAS